MFLLRKYEHTIDTPERWLNAAVMLVRVLELIPENPAHMAPRAIQGRPATFNVGRNTHEVPMGKACANKESKQCFDKVSYSIWILSKIIFVPNECLCAYTVSLGEREAVARGVPLLGTHTSLCRCTESPSLCPLQPRATAIRTGGINQTTRF